MFFKFIANIVFLIALTASNAMAITKIEISRGNIDPVPFSSPNFSGDNNHAQEIGAKISDIISWDLESTSLFRAIPHNAFLEDITAAGGVNANPNFANWRQINSSILIAGSVVNSGGNLNVSFRLWDVFAGKQIAGMKFTAPEHQIRRVAHKIADVIYNKMTGETGYFDTKIVYISESGPSLNRVKRLAVMDYDGDNHKFLSNGKTLVLTPRFSPAAHHILYLSYARKVPRVYIKDLNTGRERILGDFPGMSFAPRFTPDGKSAIFSIARGGNTQIHEINLVTGEMRKITSGNDINTSPSYTPDASKIIFNSDRSGKPQLYSMNADGSNVQRISFGQGRYATPVVSPRGDMVAFTKWGDGSGMFSIGVMRIDGSGERVIARGYMVEGPTWSPNGRVIVYTKQDKPYGRNQAAPSKIYSIDLTGHNEKELITPADASDPAWSALLED